MRPAAPGPCGNGRNDIKETGKYKFDEGVKNKKTFCGENCCQECDSLPECGGCEQCKGHPFGGSCAAERNKDFPLLKQRLIDEINALGIEGLAVDDLNLLTGSYVNLSYPLESGAAVRFLKDKDIYLENQVERADTDRCYGIVANEDFILVCEYGCNGSDPEIVLYKRRQTRAFRDITKTEGPLK